MNHPRLYYASLVVAILVAAPVLLWSSAFAQDKGKDKDAPAVKWEYKVIRAGGGGQSSLLEHAEIEKALNTLGSDGWECVGTVSEVEGGNSRVAGGQNPNWTKAILICKRPKR